MSERQLRQKKALQNIQHIVKKCAEKKIDVSTQINGYKDGQIGLDVILAIIMNQAIDGLYDPTVRKEGHLYV